MNINLNWQSLGATFRKLAILAATTLAALPQDQLNSTERIALGILGALGFTAWHYVADPSTGTPPAPSVNRA